MLTRQQVLPTVNIRINYINEKGILKFKEKEFRQKENEVSKAILRQSIILNTT